MVELLRSENPVLISAVIAALAEAGTAPDQLDGIAYTAGPGLVGALLVGGAVARSLANSFRLWLDEVVASRRLYEFRDSNVL